MFSLKEGETAAAPVSTSRGEAIIKLVEIKKPGLPAFAEVKARVVADIQKKRQDEATLASLRQAMTADATLEGIAKKLNIKIETPDAFSKGGPIPGLGAPKAVLDAVFAAKPGELKGPIAVAERGAVVVRVDSVTPFETAAFEKEKDTLKESLRGQKSNRLLQALVQKKRSDLKIEFNREFLSTDGRLEGVGTTAAGDRPPLGDRPRSADGPARPRRQRRRLRPRDPARHVLGAPARGRKGRRPRPHARARGRALLFGFATPQEKYVFERLISVSGIGPRVALTVLSGLPLPDLVRAIATQNARVLSTIPGVGKKLAERLGLELKEKLAGFGARGSLHRAERPRPSRTRSARSRTSATSSRRPSRPSKRPSATSGSTTSTRSSRPR